MVLCPPTLAGIVHLKTSLPSLAAASSAGQLIVHPTGEKGFSSDEIAATLTIEVAPPIPHDPKGASALSGYAIGWARSKSALAKWARTTAAELASPSSDAATTEDPLSISEIRNQPLGAPVNGTDHVNGTVPVNGTEHVNDPEHVSDTEPSAAPTWATR
jgi:hypothetical protein